MGPSPSQSKAASSRVSTQSSSITQNLQPVVLECNLHGQEIFVSGTFNHWRAKVPMKRYSDGVWKVMVQLPPGRIEYKFIVDGVWEYSRAHPCVTDQLGNVNNYIDVVPAHKPPMEYAWSTDVPAPELWDGQEPRPVPKQLLRTPLNSAVEPHGHESTLLLPIPEHTSLMHLFGEAAADGLRTVSITSRHESKYVTTVLHTSCSRDEPAPEPELVAMLTREYDRMRCARAASPAE